MSLKIVDSNTFVALGKKLNPNYSEQIGEYESLWLGESSPFLKEGTIHLLSNKDETIRICLLIKNDEQNNEFKNLFCFYARGSGVSQNQIQSFFGDLFKICDDLGMAKVLGPLQFSTWHPNRFVLEMGDSPYFQGEQQMPDYWAKDFISNGFAAAAEYESILVEDLKASLDLGDKMGISKALPLFQTKSYKGNTFKEIALDLFNLSLEVFKGNYAYSPITFEEFAGLLVDHAPDKTFLITANMQGQLMGFAYSYGIGNWNNNEKPVSVLKTLGVHPNFRNQKVGYGLSYLTHKYWLELGYDKIIHAYMKSDNASKSMSSHFGKRFRKYVMLTKEFNR